MSTHAGKPIITVPAGDPPTSLIIDDVVTGEGKEATAGCRPVMHYVGVAWSTGQEFDASWDRMETFSFRLGAGEVIGGWDQGVAGMKVGGRRRLIIPAELAYGAAGSPPSIPANAALVFDVDLVSVKKAG